MIQSSPSSSKIYLLWKKGTTWELTRECFTDGVLSKIIGIAAVGRSTISARVALLVGSRGRPLRLLWFGGAGGDGHRAGGEESRDGQEFGEMHCGAGEIG